MESIFTPELLVKFLYNETTPAKTLEIKQALLHDVELKQELEQMRFVKHAMEDFGSDNPSPESISAITAYAKQKEMVG